MESEAATRSKRIDPRLIAQGWVIVDHQPAATHISYKRHAIREYPTTNGPADYALFVRGRLVAAARERRAPPGGAMASSASPPTPTRPSWGGRLFFSPGQMLYVGPGAAADRHAHHLLQVAVSFDAPVEIDIGDGWAERRAVVIPADVPHTFRTQTSLLALLFIDPEGPERRSLRRRLELGAAATVAVETRLLTLPAPSIDTWDAADAAQWVARAFELLGEPAAPDPVLHPAVRKALVLLSRSLDDVPRVDDLARQTRVSGNRLMHLFSAQVGLPIRRYVLWLRLKRAAEAVIGGASLTEAAHAAGFADGAHLSRTFRDMFGMSPSLVLPLLEFVGRPWAPT